MKTFVGKDGFRFLDEREIHLRRRWFHYSPPETFSQLFRSPDWRLWQERRFPEALEVMAATRGIRDRDNDRELRWARNGVHAARVQVVDAAAVADLGSPLNYLLTYLQVTHPSEDRLLLDGDAAAAGGLVLPDTDFLIHDDELVITKYLPVPGDSPAPVVHRDAYFNRPPTSSEPDDDRPVFHRYAGLAEAVLAHAGDLTYRGPLPGLALLDPLTRLSP